MSCNLAYNFTEEQENAPDFPFAQNGVILWSNGTREDIRDFVNNADYPEEIMEWADASDETLGEYCLRMNIKLDEKRYCIMKAKYKSMVESMEKMVSDLSKLDGLLSEAADLAETEEECKGCDMADTKIVEAYRCVKYAWDILESWTSDAED